MVIIEEVTYSYRGVLYMKEYPTMTLRKADETDLPVVREMVAQLYSSDGLHAIHPSHIERTLKHLSSNPESGSVLLVEMEGQGAVGYTIVVNWWSNEYGGKAALLDELYIVPGWQGRGLGRAVIAKVEEVCREKEMPVIYLEVEQANTRARRLYEYIGFDESQRVHMRKRLVERR